MTSEEVKEQFITAYTDLQDEIFRYCFFRVYRRDLAKELTQETFTKVWKYLANGKEIEYLKSFIYKTAYHLVIDHNRKKKAGSLDALLEDGIAFKDTKVLDKNTRINCIAALQEIERLPDDYQEVVRLRYLDGLGVKEIAVIVGISENLVSVRIHRGLKQLRLSIE